MEDLFKRDSRIQELKKLENKLAKERQKLINELEENYPCLSTTITSNDEGYRFSNAITNLLEYLNNMKKKESNNIARINHAIKEIQRMQNKI